jgi:hypothetical protein
VIGLYHTTALARFEFHWSDGFATGPKKFAIKELRQDRSTRSHGRIPYAGFDIGGVSRGMRQGIAFDRASSFSSCLIFRRKTDGQELVSES